MNQEVKRSFPFKTLIWAVVVLAIVFLFKDQLAQVIGNSKNIEVFGVKIAVSEQEIEALLAEQENYEKQLVELDQELKQHGQTISSLNGLIARLKQSSENCNDARDIANTLDRRYLELQSQNRKLVEESATIKDLKAVRMTKLNQ